MSFEARPIRNLDQDHEIGRHIIGGGTDFRGGDVSRLTNLYMNCLLRPPYNSFVGGQETEEHVTFLMRKRGFEGLVMEQYWGGRTESAPVWLQGSTIKLAGAILWDTPTLRELGRRAGKKLANLAQTQTGGKNLIWESALVVDYNLLGRGLEDQLRLTFLDRIKQPGPTSQLVLAGVMEHSGSAIRCAEKCGYCPSGIKGRSRFGKLKYEYWYKLLVHDSKEVTT